MTDETRVFLTQSALFEPYKHIPAGANPTNNGYRYVSVQPDPENNGARIVMQEVVGNIPGIRLSEVVLGYYWLPRTSLSVRLPVLMKYIRLCVRECILLQTKRDAKYRGENVSLR